MERPGLIQSLLADTTILRHPCITGTDVGKGGEDSCKERTDILAINVERIFCHSVLLIVSPTLKNVICIYRCSYCQGVRFSGVPSQTSSRSKFSSGRVSGMRYGALDLYTSIWYFPGLVNPLHHAKVKK
ncbi:hypothetical protein ACGC1H_003853 [Rhizoctonia solani]